MAEILPQIESLILECFLCCNEIQNERVKEYMFHGVSRRLNVLKHTIINVFDYFPPYAEDKIDGNILIDVQINLQAFFINMIGIFDNFAWCFVHLHDAETEVGGRLNVDMFKPRTQQLLPAALRNYLQSTTIVQWHSMYLKNYRDALAHRIPVYIPPANLTPSQNARYNELETKRLMLTRQEDWEQLAKTIAEQDAIGTPCFEFLHSFSEKESMEPILIHPQILSDASTVIEFGNLFLTHWKVRA